MAAELSPAGAALLARMCTPHALDWGGTFVRYDSADELAYQELQRLGQAELFSLHGYGITARATAAGITTFTGQADAAEVGCSPRKDPEEGSDG